jgi:hydroxypyruvate reductase/glycerate 2-kinase
MSEKRRHAADIWRAAVAAVRPQALLTSRLDPAQFPGSGRILVVGAGKAGAAMAEGVEAALAPLLDRVCGWVNVPSDAVRPLRKTHLHAARPAGHNHPTAEGVRGSEEILRLVQTAGPEDVVLCLLSGGGSALLPLPVEGVTLEDKQAVTRLLHACGATINEMNAVRKHLSGIKGGRLAQAFRGRELRSLIISDVVGDPLDVIASGPTAPDPTTFADALTVLARFDLTRRVPAGTLAHLECGARGELPETLKSPLPRVRNEILANAATAHRAAMAHTTGLGYAVHDLGAEMQGDTTVAATTFAAALADPRRPLGLMAGGETTVQLTPGHGLGGRNQHFVLALALLLGAERLRDTVILSAGTDGEDGPTDAAGAFADAGTLERAAALGLDPADFLRRNDAYHFFEATGDLFKPGLTETNVMDVRVVLAG